MKFKKFIQSLEEEISAGDVAPVDNKLNLSNKPLKHLQKGKKCKEHKRLNCQECSDS